MTTAETRPQVQRDLLTRLAECESLTGVKTKIGTHAATHSRLTHDPLRDAPNANASDEIDHQERLLRIGDVERLTGIRKSSLYARIKTGAFPSPVRITARSVAWPASRVQAWIRARIAEADQQGSIA